ncbi:hypothetical protein N4G70_28950 [Streptomyces sp. ASQP_92]|uniref:hypothetical protein n=1 Tax=Streptomyces sp. ASQP_92 TaxID=2979116 RepID=UPI0021C20EA6|nr:hypothetical protein [Streptomyces sp. ASQP_92]MCT9092869.1 hypothetical protein [Streptomyces sp. ASQP_92]
MPSARADRDWPAEGSEGDPHARTSSARRRRAERDDLIKTFSEAAARAPDKGHDAATAGLTEATLHLININGKKEK